MNNYDDKDDYELDTEHYYCELLHESIEDAQREIFDQYNNLIKSLKREAPEDEEDEDYYFYSLSGLYSSIDGFAVGFNFENSDHAVAIFIYPLKPGEFNTPINDREYVDICDGLIFDDDIGAFRVSGLPPSYESLKKFIEPIIEPFKDMVKCIDWGVVEQYCEDSKEPLRKAEEYFKSL